MFENDVWLNFFKELQYTPPLAKHLSSSLLDEIYTETIDHLLSSSSSLTLATDESTNVALNRMVNTCIITDPGGSIYWKKEEVEEGAQTAEQAANYLVENIRIISRRTTSPSSPPLLLIPALRCSAYSI